MTSSISFTNGIPVRFDSKNKLDKFFTDLKNSVPRREDICDNSERQYRKEVYCLERYIRTLPFYSKQDAYPVKIEKRESPDFCVHSSMGHIGIEITEATQEKYQKFLSDMSKNDDHNEEDCYDEVDCYNPEGYVDDNFEYECLEMIRCAIQRKSEKLSHYKRNNPDITAHELLIYLNMDMHPQCEIFAQNLPHYIPKHHGFDCISIIISFWESNKEYLLYNVSASSQQKLMIALE